MEELQAFCVDQIEIMSKKRIMRLITGGFINICWLLLTQALSRNLFPRCQLKANSLLHMRSEFIRKPGTNGNSVESFYQSPMSRVRCKYWCSRSMSVTGLLCFFVCLGIRYFSSTSFIHRRSLWGLFRDPMRIPIWNHKVLIFYWCTEYCNECMN